MSSAIDAAIQQAEQAASAVAPQAQPPQQQTTVATPQQQPAVDPNSGYWAINGQPVAPGTPGAVWTAYAAPAAPQQPVPQQHVPNTMPAAQAAPQSQAVAAYAPPGQKMSMDDMSSGLLVDFWLTVNEYGLILEKEKKNLFTSMLVEIDMTEGQGFVPKMSIKAGNPAQYWSTTDGVTSDKGIPWAQAVAQAQAIDARAYEFRSADVLMTLAEDIEGSNGKGYKEGDNIGLTLSTTNWKNWAMFYKKVQKAGLLGQTVKVKVTSEERSNKNDNVWGVVAFDLAD